jgi:hypothetical protein
VQISRRFDDVNQDQAARTGGYEVRPDERQIAHRELNAKPVGRRARIAPAQAIDIYERVWNSKFVEPLGDFGGMVVLPTPTGPVISRTGTRGADWSFVTRPARAGGPRQAHAARNSRQVAG